MSEELLTTEDIENVREVLDSQVRLGHAFTMMPTDVLSRLLAAALAASGATLDARLLNKAMWNVLRADERRGSVLFAEDSNAIAAEYARLSGAVTFSDNPDMQRGLDGQASEEARRLVERLGSRWLAQLGEEEV